MIKAFDFFCGAGGLTRGFLNAGIDVLAGIDIAEHLKKTYEENNRPALFLHKDIKTFDIRQTRKDFGVTKNDRVLYAACTPCQPFSTLNQNKRADDRKDLLLAFADVVEAAPPDFIFVENVPGLNNAYGRDVYQKFLEKIALVGFDKPVSAFLDAKDYGVAQVRKRFVLLVSRHGMINLPRRARRKLVVRDVLKRFPAVADGDESSKVYNHVTRKLAAHLKRIVEAVPKDGGSRSDVVDTSILLKCHQDRPKVHKDVFGRMSWDAPSPTMTCRCTDVYCGRFTHPEQDRGLTLREAAALQSFPDDYRFHGNLNLIAEQIGNAVPPELARRLGVAIVEAGKKRRARRK